MYNFCQPFGIESVSLVERIFSDLITTTQSYEQLSNNSKTLMDDLDIANNSIYPLKKENNRLLKENNKVILNT